VVELVEKSECERDLLRAWEREDFRDFRAEFDIFFFELCDPWKWTFIWDLGRFIRDAITGYSPSQVSVDPTSTLLGTEGND
jgi:hypothetical protein